MNSISTLSQLLTALQASATADGTVTLDTTFLDSDVAALMQSSLELPGPSLTLNNVNPADVTLSGNTTIIITGGTAAATIVNLPSEAVSVAIQQTTSGSATRFDLIVNITLPSGWTFGASFPQLAGLQPPDYLDFAGGPNLFFSSFATPPAIAEFPVPAGAGLNYTAAITPGGVFAAVAHLISAQLPSVPIAGIIVPDPLEFDLQAPITGQASVTLGYIQASASVPWLGIKVVDSSAGGDSSGGGDTEILALALLKADGDGHGAGASAPALLYYLGTKVAISNSQQQSVDFELDVGIPTPSTTTFDVTLASGSATPLSLGNLASVLFNTSDTALESAAGPLASVLTSATANITLQYLTATFDIAGPQIQKVTGLIGTSIPSSPNTWSPGLPGLPAIDLTLAWSIDFTQTPAAWDVIFTAVMAINANLSFSVTVTAPKVVITGAETGTVTIGTSDLASAFGGGFTNLADVANLSLTGFQITADIDAKMYTVTGSVAASLNLFGVQLLSIQDMTVGLTVDASQTTTVYTFTFDGNISFGSLTLNAQGSVTNDPSAHTTFTMHLVNQTVGSMLNSLVQLVDPSYTISFDAPWDAFLNINLDALVLTVDVTAGTVGLTYTDSIDLAFIEIDSIGLTYTKASGTTASSTQVQITGSFLGIQYGTGNPIQFDPMNEAPPATPAAKAPIFDLVYAGLGQHIGFQGTQPSTIADVMTKLQQSVIPVQAGQLPEFGGAGELAFQADSNWLIGAQFSIMGTVAISAVFNDPNLYGILIALSGDKAGPFAGLSFEILYRKVTDTIGVYHIELKLPDAMRNLQFGEVSITLPIVILDIYTNGNFRVDFGFPVGLDFSNSFCVQVFPFVGYGGFYFALLDGATSSKVPVITNGDFSPVIEFGVALSIGVGKTVNEGILSGGISVTVVGILQGVLGWFNPSDNSNKEVYYWFQGTIAIVGKLYATIDFGIVQASLDVTAYASVTLTIEAHQPIYIAISAGVSVEVSVKIIFFTIHFSFNAQVNASFTIGSATPTPWILKQGSGGGSSSALLRASAAMPVLATPHGLRAAAAMSRPGLRQTMRRALIAAPDSITNWAPVNVFGGAIQNAQLWALPGFTKAGTATTSANAILLLAANNSISPGATNAQERAVLADDASAAPFNLLMQAMLSWGIFTVATPNPAPPYTMPAAVTADQLEQLRKLLLDPATTAAAFNYQPQSSTGLAAFLAANFLFNIVPSDGSPQGVAIFPMIPALSLSDNGSITTPINFGAPAVDAAYAEKVKAYFQLLAVQFAARSQTQASGTSQGLVAAAAPSLSIAEIVFSQYFNMLMSAGVKSAIDLLASYPATTTGPMTVAQIGTQVGGSALAEQLTAQPLLIVTPNQDLAVLNTGAQLTFTDVAHQIKAGDTLASIVQGFQALQVLDLGGQPYSIADLLAANASAVEIFNPATVAFSGIEYVTVASDTLGLIAARLLVRAGAPALANSLVGLAPAAAALETANPSITNPNAPIAAGTTLNLSPGTYTAVANDSDTLTLIAAYIVEAVQNPGPVANLVAQIQNLNSNVQDPPPIGTNLKIPPIARTLAANDSINGLASLLLTPASVIEANLTAPASSAVYATNANDTLNMIGARVLVTAGGQTLLNSLSTLAAQVAALQGLNTGSWSTNPLAAIPAGTAVTLPAGASYTSVAGDTLTLVAGYLVEIAQNASAVGSFVAALLAVNPNLTIQNPAQTQPTGTAIQLPPLDPLLAANGMLQVPLIYPVQNGDTLSGIASKFNLTLENVANAAVGNGVASSMPEIFAAATLTISDVPNITVSSLLGALLTQAEFNNASGMVSRFLLSGLQLPDPASTAFQNLTLQQLQNPTALAGIPVKPLYALTGQQYSIANSVPAGYQITLVNSGVVPWLQFNGQAASSLQFPLSLQQTGLVASIASETFSPQPATLTRLALFQMTPPRIALQNHVQWQPAALPGSLSNGTPGNPGIWLFPDSLVTQLENATPPPLLYQVVVARDSAPDTPVIATPAQRYVWGTVVDFTISKPTTDGPAASVSNTYVIGSADDTGAALLQTVYNYLNSSGDTASLYLLYSPNPSGGNPSGLVSDNVNTASSYILKTNLSTLTNSGATLLRASPGTAPFDPATTYAAAMNQALGFIALLFEASVTRSGGFYLNYFNGTAPLPATVFGNSSTATISLLILLNSQSSANAPIQPFNNCAVVADNIDTASSTVFVQPAIYVVQPPQTVVAATAAFNAWTNGSLTTVQWAQQQGALQPLAPGVTITVPQTATSIQYAIQPTDTLSSISTAQSATSLTDLVNANLTVAIVAANTLTIVVNSFNAAYGALFTVAQVAAFNQSVPQLLLVGAPMTIPTSGGNLQYSVGYGDTLQSIATAQGATSLEALIAANVNAEILAPGSPMQFASNILSPATTVPPGVAGFEMTLPNMGGDTLGVGQLFNMVGYQIANAGAFLASGAGLPTTPSASPIPSADGLTTNPPSASTTDPWWYYTQSLAVSPFAALANGSASGALPAASQNPYNGVGGTAAGNNQITIELALQDIYGNTWPLPSADQSLAAPVGYYDNIVSLGSWPSLALSYTVSGASPAVTLDMSMNQSRYIPQPGIADDSALQSIAADLTTYRGIYYQLAQPDFSFTFQTTLDQTSMAAPYPLSPLTFQAFARGAYIYLAAMQTMQAAQFQAGASTVQQVTGPYGLSGAQLFVANQNQPFVSLFAGASSLTVPLMYATANGDSLQSIVTDPSGAHTSVTLTTLVTLNAAVALQAGADFAATRANVTPQAADSLATLAARSLCSVVSLALANAPTPNVLAAGTYTVGTQSVTLTQSASFSNLAAQLNTSISSLALAIQSQPSVFVANVSLVVADVVAQATDTLQSLATAYAGGNVLDFVNASNPALNITNSTVQNLYPVGASLQIGTQQNPIFFDDDTLASFAVNNKVTVSQLGNFNPAATFVAGAVLSIPGAVQQPAVANVANYTAIASDTLGGIANRFGQADAATIATLNAAEPSLFVAGQTITDPASQKPVTTAPGDSFNSILARFQGEGVSLQLAQLAAIMASQTGLVQAGGVWVCQLLQYCTYTAGPSDNLSLIAGKFGLADGAAIVGLNPDLPGLLIPGQTITDPVSGKSVATAQLDTFAGIQASFASQNVTLQLAQIATIVGAQTGLIQPGGLWICPPMQGNAGGQNSAGSLAGLAAAYNIVPPDSLTPAAVNIGTANAAALGFLASGINLGTALFGQLNNYVTTSSETLNSLVNRVNATGYTISGLPVTVGEVASAVAGIANLINPAAVVLPVPPPNPPSPPSPLANSVGIKPGFADAVFQIAVNVISQRNWNWVDTDFRGSRSVGNPVCMSVYSVSPNPDPQSPSQTPTFTLTQFATQLQQAITGLYVATGPTVAEADPPTASTIWGVNFGSAAGPQITYQFQANQAQYFALPPLCTSLVGGLVNINPYASGSGVDQQHTVSLTFQSVDLDAWMNTFLTTVDLFLSPAYASGAYAIDPADVLSIIGAKSTLANNLAGFMQYVLVNQQTANPLQGSLADAIEAMTQAMLTELGSAYTVDALVQAPVLVANASTQITARLSGKLQLADAPGDSNGSSIPAAYSFSTAKVEVPANSPSNTAETATFLFSVKSAPQNKAASLTLNYQINELELPNGSGTLGNYEDSDWLQFILPIDTSNSQLGQVDIPIPLRFYPSPVLLVSQTAASTVAQPQRPADLLGWNMDFVYQHDDAEQDTPTVVVTFNPPASGSSLTTAGAAGALIQNIFRALAQFMSAYPALKDDLALLPTAPPASNAKALCAVQSLAWFVSQVVAAFHVTLSSVRSALVEKIYAYRFEKQFSPSQVDAPLTGLVITSVDPDTGAVAPNPTELWPTVYEYYESGPNGQALTQVTTSSTNAIYTYPDGSNIPADAQFPQQFFFGLPSSIGTVTIDAPGSNYAVNDVVTVVQSSAAGGLATVTSVDTGGAVASLALLQAGNGYSAATGLATTDSGAGSGLTVTITIDTTLDLPAGVSLPNAQVFQFIDQNIFDFQAARAGVSITRNQSLVSTSATNSVFVYQTPLTNFTGVAVPYNVAGQQITLAGSSVAVALGNFLQPLFAQNQWQSGDTIAIRVAAAYSYALASTPGQAPLTALVPIVLVPDYGFHPVPWQQGSTQMPADWDATSSVSLVSQLETVVTAWQSQNKPATAGGSFAFDITIYSFAGNQQALILLEDLIYPLGST